MNKKDKIRILMSSHLKCEECPAEKYCKNTNMSCEDTRLKYVCFLQRKADISFCMNDELEKEEIMLIKADEHNYMWNKKEERRLEDLYNENDSDNR